MTTINQTTMVPQPNIGLVVARPAIRVANKSTMHSIPLQLRRNATKTWWQRVKNAIGEWCYAHPVSQLVCCFNSDEYELHQMDESIREDIRIEMLSYQSYYGKENAVLASLQAARSEFEYEMRTQPDVLETSDGVDVVKCLEPYNSEVLVVPKFAAAMVCHLRSRLGVMRLTDVNQLLVEREYHRLSRLYGVRDADIAAHYAHVKNAYFSERVFDRVAMSRRSMPRFLKWVMNVDSCPVEPPQAC